MSILVPPYPQFLTTYIGIKTDCEFAQQTVRWQMTTAVLSTPRHTTLLDPLRHDLRALLMRILLCAYEGESYSDLMHTEARNEDIARRYYVLMDRATEMMMEYLTRASSLEFFILAHGWEEKGKKETGEQVRVAIEELREKEERRVERLREAGVLDDAM